MLSRFYLSALVLAITIAIIYYLIYRSQQHTGANAEQTIPSSSLREWYWRFVQRNLFNQVRRYFGLRPRWILPAEDNTQAQFQRLHNLLDALAEALHHNPHLNREQQQQIWQQALDSGHSMTELAWLLHRTYKLQGALSKNSASHQELHALQQQIRTEMQDALKVLEQMPISLLKLELAREEAHSAALLAALIEANQKMRDLLWAHTLCRSSNS